MAYSQPVLHSHRRSAKLHLGSNKDVADPARMEFDNGRNRRPRPIRSIAQNQRSQSDRREARSLGRRQSLAVLEAGCCPPPFGIEHSGSCLRFPIETLTLAASVGAKVEVSLLDAMRFTAVRTVRNI